MILMRLQYRLGFLRGALARLRLGRDRIGRSLWLAPRTRLIATRGGNLRLGDNVAVQDGAVVQVRDGALEIGSDGFVGTGATIVACESVRIGRDVLIGEYVTIRDQDHDFAGPNATAQNGMVTAPIRIGDNVWLGAKVTVLKGVTIGDNVVVGANSVVTRDLPDNVVAAGSPAVVIKEIGSRHARDRKANGDDE